MVTNEKIHAMKNYFCKCCFFIIALGGWGVLRAEEQALSAVEPPLMGWSSWNTYRVNINEALICKQADAMVEQGLQAAGYSYVNIDDGFSVIAIKKDCYTRMTSVFPTESNLWQIIFIQKD